MGYDDPEFEWDLEKSDLNFIKHGVSFEEAKALWGKTKVDLPAKAVNNEERFAVVGLIDDVVFACIYTIREGRIRIISCRRARKKEEEVLYEKNENPGT